MTDNNERQSFTSGTRFALVHFTGWQNEIIANARGNFMEGKKSELILLSWRWIFVVSLQLLMASYDEDGCFKRCHHEKKTMYVRRACWYFRCCLSQSTYTFTVKEISIKCISYSPKKQNNIYSKHDLLKSVHYLQYIEVSKSSKYKLESRQ